MRRRRRSQAYRPYRDSIVFPVGMRDASPLGIAALAAWGALWVFIVAFMAMEVVR